MYVLRTKAKDLVNDTGHNYGEQEKATVLDEFGCHWFSSAKCFRRGKTIRMDLYIHPLKGIFYPSHHKIYSFLVSIHPLYHPLSTVGLTCHFI
jgi:hypothetical protein